MFVLNNPWGLLALLSIPLIVALHFFRNPPSDLRIGGLHLWEEASTRQPTGRRWRRLERSWTLLGQLFVALLLSLLIAGLDLPREVERRHFVVLLDDSVSMQAGREETSADRARRVIRDWAQAEDRFTAIAAGDRARVIAGPFADRMELHQALETWTPESAGADLLQAVELAVNFSTEAGKLLFVSDQIPPEGTLTETIEVAAVGRADPNVGITLGDRVRRDASTDWIQFVVHAFSDEPQRLTVRAQSLSQALFQQDLTLQPGESQRLSFETRSVDEPIEIILDEDVLAPDNRIVLEPVSLKVVRVAQVGLTGDPGPLFKAVGAIPHAQFVADPGEADLVFSFDSSYQPTANNRQCVYLPAAALDEQQLKTVKGNEVIVARDHRVVENLSLDGVLWTYQAQAVPDFVDQEILVHRGMILLGQELTESPSEPVRIWFNLVWDRTNLFKQPAWPMLVQAFVESTRILIPGPSRTNLRVGEPVYLNLAPVNQSAWILEQNGQAIDRFDIAPTVLTDLSRGRYRIRGEDGSVVAAFAVNLFAPSESDLTGASSRQADFSVLVGDEWSRRELNPVVFYTLLIIIISLVAALWYSQQTSA